MKKNRACKRGLVTSDVVGYLFYFFLPRRGCREEKKSCAFNTGSSTKSKYNLVFEGLNPCKTGTDFSRQKT